VGNSKQYCCAGSAVVARSNVVRRAAIANLRTIHHRIPITHCDSSDQHTFSFQLDRVTARSGREIASEFHYHSQQRWFDNHRYMPRTLRMCIVSNAVHFLTSSLKTSLSIKLIPRAVACAQPAICFLVCTLESPADCFLNECQLLYRVDGCASIMPGQIPRLTWSRTESAIECRTSGAAGPTRL
jgi:hypothetical protein